MHSLGNGVWRGGLNRAKAGRRFFLSLKRRHWLRHVSKRQKCTIRFGSSESPSTRPGGRVTTSRSQLSRFNFQAALIWLNVRLGAYTNTFGSYISARTRSFFVRTVGSSQPRSKPEKLVKRPDTSSGVHSSRKGSDWSQCCSLGFTRLPSNYSIPSSILCFFT